MVCIVYTKIWLDSERMQSILLNLELQLASLFLEYSLDEANGKLSSIFRFSPTDKFGGTFDVVGLSLMTSVGGLEMDAIFPAGGRRKTVCLRIEAKKTDN